MGDGAVEVTAVTNDARRVTPGALFVAVPGFRADGHDYVAAAAARGAAAAVVMKPVAGVALPQVVVADARLALAEAAAAFFGHPGRELAVVGVTGTKGKTTTCYVLDGILRAAGAVTARCTTITTDVAGDEKPARLTTAEAPELQATLRAAVERGARWAVVEVSSHALALKRVATVPFAAAVFTNLSHDHLDLHGDEESYFAAKAALFDQLTPDGVAVVNVDDPYGVRLADKLRGRAVTVGVANDACDFRATDVAATWEGARFTLREGRGAAYEVTTPLPGAFNVYNCLAAAATARALGVDADAVRRGVAATTAVPGRLEVVPVREGLQVVVDYAHSPASFAEALAEIRKLEAEYYVVVFGCTGDRDRAKRPIMGELAARAADYVIITSDDPHYEDPAGIAAEISPAVAATGVRYDVELDRARAIRLALAAAPAGRRTVVAVLGKGHEKVQHLAGRDVPFDDVAQIREAAAALGLADAAGRG